ncbi:hypothetical protein Tco_1416238, partial [Tanacetum coccineum]
MVQSQSLNQSKPRLLGDVKEEDEDLEWLPIWWRWYYRTNPVAWSLYGLLTSQYGDANEPLKLADDSRSVPLRQLLKDQFGYENEFLCVGTTDM